jgi:hypothetical protein
MWNKQIQVIQKLINQKVESKKGFNRVLKFYRREKYLSYHGGRYYHTVIN